MEHDQTAWQAWLIAIPSVLTALSHWYTNRKTTKTIAKSDVKTAAVVTEKSSELETDIKALSNRIFLLENSVVKRVDILEKAVKDYGDRYIILSAGYTDTVEKLKKEIAESHEKLKESLGQNKIELVDNFGQPADKNIKPPEPNEGNFGKVTWDKGEKKK